MKYILSIFVLFIYSNAFSGDSFVDNGDGSITDNKTGLIWKKCSEGLSGDSCQYGSAKDYSLPDALSLTSGSWRLPTIQELRTLMLCSNGPTDKPWVKGCSNEGSGHETPTINQKYFPNIRREYYWTSTVFNKHGDHHVVNFDWGITTFGQYGKAPVLLVKTKEAAQRAEGEKVNEVVDSKELTQPQQSELQIASNIRLRIEQLLKNGRAMERYRNTNTGMRACGEMMRDNLPKAKALRSEAMELSTRYFNHLRVASIEVITCVTCSDDAIEDCERVAETLNAE
ncbi:DUF1566 domain-containing protein [Leucothrix mucor]|uniref:Lcl C-terminal domain-containing protein n=1 Tax=Leucothrix mucor TaxID=45248 RepID=UPI0003B731B0|nr:DUF1566 domain-containing protein [Leucothrix mucor]